MSKKIQLLLPYVVITGVSLVIVRYIFRDAFWHPNSYVFMSGGDGNVIYFNMLYHVLYGQGVYLGNMNYPDPDCIFMTDAQGSISLLLNTLKSVFPIIKTHTVGIIHVLFMIAIWGQYIFLYKIIRVLKGDKWVAVLFAIGIGSLSPQLVRISYGHFGLAYPFIIPMTIYWILEFKKYAFHNCRNIVFVITVLFFGFNNPYLMVIVSIILISYGGVAALIERSFRQYYLPLFLGFGFLVTLFLVLNALDPFDDRIQNQWGSFYYSSTVEGLFWGRYSLVNDLLGSIGFPYEGQPEARATIGLTCLTVLVLGSIYYAKRLFKDKSLAWSHPVVVLTLASGISFLYASSFFKSKWWLWLTEDLGFITMVKAAGRLSWINYYILSILSVLFLIKLGRLFQKQIIIQVLIYISGLGLCVEGFVYVKDHVRPNLYSNHFSSTNLQQYIISKKESIDFSNYQGIISIPMVQSWNDNLMNSGDWATELQSFSMAVATGVPLIGAKLSRAPVGRSLENFQLLADPLIEREIIKRFDADKPVLLIKTCNINATTPGAKWLMNHGRLIYQNDNVDIFEVWPEDLQTDHFIREQIQSCTDRSNWFYMQHFNNSSVPGKLGSGLVTGTEWQEVDNIAIPDSVSGMYELSIWSYVNIEKHGMPVFEIWVFNSPGEKIAYHYVDSRNFVDNQNGWIKMHHNLEIQPEYRVILKAKGRYPMKIDELLLRPLDGSQTCIEHPDQKLSINNIEVH